MDYCYQIGNEERRWILVKYEKFHEFCFACKRLGNLLKSCGGGGIKKTTYDQDKIRFGPKLRGYLLEIGVLESLKKVLEMKKGIKEVWKK